MNQKRHATNEIYRQVADFVGLDTVRAQQQDMTGKAVTPQTARRYYNGYGNAPIPTPAFNAARELLNAALVVSSVAVQVGLKQDPNFREKIATAAQAAVRAAGGEIRP